MERPNSLMASSSSSSSSKTRTDYDVFLSFRGEDTRNNFLSHLHKGLCQKGIYTFLDDDKLDRGKPISAELLKAIEGSSCCVVLLSRNYASSKWCLEELVKIHQCMKDSAQPQIVLPIFYHVDPSDVRKQTASFGEAFQRHETEFSHDLEKVERWRNALTDVGNLAGWHLQDRDNEAKFIQDFVTEVLSKLDVELSNISEDLFGMDLRLEELNLCIYTSSIRFVGICGMGGIGKTTLARAYYERMSYQFEASSFLANVRTVCEKKEKGVVKLQKQLLSDILNGEHKVNDIYHGKGIISRRLCNKKVLVILDDVDELSQLKGLAEKDSWFGSGSRIIVTTRNKSLLRSTYFGGCIIHEVEQLNDSDALQLFSWKAFQSIHPLEDYKALSEQVIAYARGLPLALDVLGSFLCDATVIEWESALDRLKEYPEENIIKVLRLSFDGLKEIEKDLFLDIACFFRGFDKDYVTNIAEICGFHPKIGIRALVDKSLLYIQRDNTLWMHDLLEEMGGEIVAEKSRYEPGRRSRIWNEDDISHIIEHNTGTEEVEAMVCPCIYPREETSFEAFSNMKKLRMLIIYDTEMSVRDGFTNFEYLSNELRLLVWDTFPFKYLPPSFLPRGLVELRLTYSKIVQLWKNPIKQQLNKLKVIDLSHSRNFSKFEDFNVVPNLEQLIHRGRSKLVEIHPSITILKSLILLNLRSCSKLKYLPTSIQGLTSLKVLQLSGCAGLGNLPQDLGLLSSLEELLASDTSLTGLPASMNQLSKLRFLDLCSCKKLRSLGPELPYSLEMVRVEYCSSLETFLDPLSQCNLRCSAICFNCFELVKRQGSKTTAISSLQRYLQNPPNPSKTFEIVLPGNEIPDWFTHQSSGPSITLQLHPNWCHHEWMGFSLCVCFRGNMLPNLYCDVKINGQDWGFGRVECSLKEAYAKSDHLWVLYLPRDLLIHTEWDNNCQQIKFSFTTNETITSEQCGVRLVYEHNIQELNSSKYASTSQFDSV